MKLKEIDTIPHSLRPKLVLQMMGVKDDGTAFNESGIPDPILLRVHAGEGPTYVNNLRVTLSNLTTGSRKPRSFMMHALNPIRSQAIYGHRTIWIDSVPIYFSPGTAQMRAAAMINKLMQGE